MRAACGSAGGQPPEIPPRHPFLGHDQTGSPVLLPRRWVPPTSLPARHGPRVSPAVWLCSDLELPAATGESNLQLEDDLVNVQTFR